MFIASGRFTQSWASPQLRTNEKSCGHADFSSLNCGLFLIVVLNFASFVQILKFLSIFVKYLFLPSQT